MEQDERGQDSAALEELGREHGGGYRIVFEDGAWHAQPRDGGEVVRRASAPGLELALRAARAAR